MSSKSIKVIDVDDSGSLNDGKIRIGLSNIHVSASNILNSAVGVPNLSNDRYKSICDLIRLATEASPRVDLLVFPEVSIPHAYLKAMQRFSRVHQIGMVFGLEHRFIDRNTSHGSRGKALNHVVTILPSRKGGKFNTCTTLFRLKRYYAPEEIAQLRAHRLELPSKPPEDYYLFHWRGCYFSVFNCYELANAVERSWFRSKIDFLIAVEWNPDINYFSNIAEASSRDLHCYFIQVNSTQFGDSRIVSPQRTIEMNILRTKGGVNETILIGEIDIRALRSFQNLSQEGQKADGRYKITPPEYCYETLAARIADQSLSDFK